MAVSWRERERRRRRRFRPPQKLAVGNPTGQIEEGGVERESGLRMRGREKHKNESV